MSDNVFTGIGGSVRSDERPAALTLGSETTWVANVQTQRGFPSHLIARRNKLVGNDVGIWIRGILPLPLDGSTVLDFGTSGDLEKKRAALQRQQRPWRSRDRRTNEWWGEHLIRR